MNRTFIRRAGIACLAFVAVLAGVFQLPNDSPIGGANISVSVEVDSDQPISVGAGFPTIGFSGPCGAVSK